MSRLSIASLVTLLALPAPLVAQVGNPSGVRAKHHAAVAFDQGRSANVARSLTRASALGESGSGTPVVVGGVLGAAIGGLLGRQFALGTCEFTNRGCETTRAVITGAAVGLLAGVVVGWIVAAR